MPTDIDIVMRPTDTDAARAFEGALRKKGFKAHIQQAVTQDAFDTALRIAGGKQVGDGDEHSLLHALTEQSIAGIFVFDLDGTILYVNPKFAEMLGYEVDDVLDRDFAPFVSESTRAHVVSTFRDVAEGRVPKAQVASQVNKSDGGTVELIGQIATGRYRGEAAVIGVSLDVTAQKLDQVSLSRVSHALNILGKANEALVRADDEQGLLDAMCKALVEHGGYRFAWIGLSADRPGLAVRAQAFADEHNKRSTDAHDLDSAEAVLRSGTTLVDQDISVRVGVVEGHGGEPSRGSRIVLPLSDRGTTLGVLTLYAPQAGAFTRDEIALLNQLAANLAYGIASLRERGRREQSEHNLRRAMEAAVQAIASTLEMRDPYTAGHQREVARLAVSIAHEIGVDDDKIEGIYLAAVVHDVGKIRIPIDILSKPGPLTDLEYELIQTHAQIGYDIMRQVDFPWPVAEMILQHHERLDGSGYPRALKGDEILPGARIIAVADVVQAMSMRRPYRGAYGVHAALDEIERGRGTLYDPAVVDACLKLFREKRFKFA